MNAIAFLYREAPIKWMPYLDKLQRAKRKQNVPVVMSVTEISTTFERNRGMTRLMENLIYGVGMRISECITLRGPINGHKPIAINWTDGPLA